MKVWNSISIWHFHFLFLTVYKMAGKKLPKNRPISIWLLWRVQRKLNLISMKNSKFFFNCLKSQLSDPFGCCKKVVEARFASEVAFLNSTPHENLPPLENSKKKWVWQKGTRGKTETILEKDFQGDICHIEVVVNFDLTSDCHCWPQKWHTFLIYCKNDQLGCIFCKTSSICVNRVVVFVK